MVLLLPPIRTGSILLLAVGLLFAFGCRKKSPALDGPGAAGATTGAASTGANAGYSPYHDIPGAEFVGAKSCVECHQQAYDEWTQSDHHKAMEPANEKTVLGDFDDVAFTHFERTTRLYRKGEEFWVNAEDGEGKRVDLKVEYTFGHYPLQQYLVPWEGGRYQALQVCWDSRPKEEGGQRWYHLYPDEEIPPDDPLHWTRRHFNWNRMCADCHSTKLEKNFDVATESYHTTWSEMNVSCEACHGPASEHLVWAKEVAAAKADGDEKREAKLLDPYASKGLVVKLKEPVEGGWYPDLEAGIPKRSTPIASNVQVDTCARCHSHRQLMAPNYTAGQSFHDTHSPSVLSDMLYHHDGQVDEEVYVYGSYVQSKMYHAGVRCTDCHHPHTMKLLAPGNALCIRCHQGDKYNTPAHHHHLVGSTGAACVECHMPHKNYMGVDARRDHSLRIPRPDLAAKTGSPDACTNCHTDKPVTWAKDAFLEWWGNAPRKSTPGEVIAPARAGKPGALDKLRRLAMDMDRSGIVRATAVETLGRGPMDEAVIEVLRGRVADPDPAVRKEVLRAVEVLPPERRLAIAGGLLRDPVRSVRVSAARAMAGATQGMDAATRTAFDEALGEFFTAMEAVDDTASGHMGRALVYEAMGDTAKAIASYRVATRIQPEHAPSWINLAEMLYRAGDESGAEVAFSSAVKESMMPEEEGMCRDAYARFLARVKRYDEAVVELGKSVTLCPLHADTWYFYGVALHSTGKSADAFPVLEQACKLDPGNVEYRTGLATIARDAGQMERALQYAQEALKLQPGNPQLQGLVRSLMPR